MPINAAQLMVNIGANPAGAVAGINTVAGMLGKDGMLGMAVLGAGAVMAGVGIAATKMAGDFQAGITSLATGAGESQANLQLVRDGILQLARDTGTSTKQLVDGMYMIESGGFHGKAGLDILKAAAQGAKVGTADLGVVADTVDTILKNYGENGAMNATQATNALITTVANGKTHLEDLAQSLAFVLPAGAAAGLGLKDVMGAMATMTSVGVPAAESATYLRQMIIALEAPSAGARHELEKIGITSKELGAAMKRGLPDALQLIETQLAKHGIKAGSAEYVAALREISGGTRQMQGMLNLMGPHLKTFKEDVGKIGGVATSTSKDVKGWAQVQGNMNQQFDRAKETAATLMIQLGTKLLPVATNLFKFLADTGLPALQHFVQFLSGSSSQAQILRPILLTVAIAIGGALVAAFIAWAVSAAAAAIATIAATWPILAIGAAIALLVAGIIFAVTHWKQITDAIGHFKDMIGNAPGPVKILLAVLFPIPALIALIVSHWKQITEALGHFKDKVGEVLGAIGNFFGTFAPRVLNQFTLPFRVAGTIIHNTLTTIHKTIQHAIDTVLGIFKGLYEHNIYVQRMVDGIRTKIEFLKIVIPAIINAVKDWLLAKWNEIKADAMAAWALFQVHIVKPVEQAIAAVQAKFIQARTWLVGKFNEIKGDAEAAWNKFVAIIGNLVGQVKAKITQIIDTILKPITGLGQTLFNAGKNLIQMLINGIQSMAGNVKNTVGNIAGNIGKFLGFHSPTEEGPGRTADQWMPNLMKMLSAGIDKNLGQLQGAAHRAAGTISGAFGVPSSGTGGGSSLARLPSSLQAASQTIQINLTHTVNLDGRKVAQGIAPHLHTVIRNATGKRSF